MFFCLNSRNPIMGFCICKILQGKLLIYSGTPGCCLLRDCLYRSAEVCQGKAGKTYLTGLAEMRLFPSDHDKQVNSNKKCLGNSQWETPISDMTSNHSDPVQSSAISSVCWSIENKKLLKNIYEIQSMENALQSKGVWLYKAPVLIKYFLLPKQVNGCMYSCNPLICLKNKAA